MFNIKLEEKSWKMSFKALSVKIQRSKNWQGEADRVKGPLLGRLRVLSFGEAYSQSKNRSEK